MKSKGDFGTLEQVQQGLVKQLHGNKQLVSLAIPPYPKKVMLFYISYLVEKNKIDHDIIQPIQQMTKKEELYIRHMLSVIPITETQMTSDVKEAASQLLKGYALLYVQGSQEGILIPVAKKTERSITKAETESQIYGSPLSLTESLETNAQLIRNSVSSSLLVEESLQVGKMTSSSVSLFYVKGTISEQIIHTVKQRIQNIEFDLVTDSGILVQLIEDNNHSLFPQLLMTERLDRIVVSLLEGKAILLLDQSPFAIVCPCNFFDFFKSTEDYYVRWSMGTFFRLLRLFSMVISAIFTPVYVAATTFHYEIIPSALLVPLAQSRSKVPFPPLFESLLLEFIIELLREAGARLPTKVGQTMGIVGGIVIGTAAVQAGFTSNILIIIVAFGALASFSFPSYMMGNAIRIIRFPLIILAGTWGGLGIMFGLTFLLLHLLQLTSMGNPYLYPIYPLRIQDVKDSVVRFPFTFFSKRPSYSRGENKQRFPNEKAVREEMEEDD